MKVIGHPLHFFIPRLGISIPKKLNERPINYGEQIHHIEYPIIPFEVFGLKIHADLVIGLSHDDGFGMLEICKTFLDENHAVWFTLDSKLDGEQFIGLPQGNLKETAATIATQFPANVYEANLEVNERGEKFDVKYTRFDGELIHFTCQAPIKISRPLLKNGNVMNHSEKKALTSIELSSLRPLKKLKFISSPKNVLKLLGFPVAHMLRQTVFGITYRDFSYKKDDVILHGTTVEFAGFVTKKYIFKNRDPYLELEQIELFQNGELIGHVHFDRPLPDLRYSLNGPWEGQVSLVSGKDFGLNKGSLHIKDGKLTYRGQSPSFNKNKSFQVTYNVNSTQGTVTLCSQRN